MGCVGADCGRGLSGASRGRQIWRELVGVCGERRPSRGGAQRCQRPQRGASSRSFTRQTGALASSLGRSA
eukprot:scaffold374337_cov45-Prasinocladus_malaysianus.AAC.1